MKKFILSIGLLLGAMSLSAGVVYVAPNAVGDSTGSSWDNAMENIQMAINKAKQDPTGTTDVWVKAGTYNIPATIALKDSVNVYGSFAGTETSVDERAMVEGGKPWEFANPTIINGGKTIPCMDGNKICNQPVVINGFILEDGVADKSTNPSTSGGGGIRLTKGLTLAQSIVRNCTSKNDGGGIRIYPDGAVRYCLIENCSQEESANGGGGINAATSSSGVLIEIEGCELRGNTTDIRGGGLAINGNSGKVLVNGCTFYNNSSITIDKGGAAIFDNAGNISEITNCVFYNNTGYNELKEAVTNVLYIKPGKFNNNTVVFNMGGVYVAGGKKTSEVCNNVVWANVIDEAAETATSISGTAVKGLLALNNYTYNPVQTDKGWTLSLDPNVENTNVAFASNKSNGDFEVKEGEEAPEGKCLTGPHFVQVPTFFGAIPADLAEADKKLQLAELEAADFHIKRQSALLNTGTDSAFVEADRDGNNRPQGPRTDVGAYELAYHAVVIPAYDAAEGIISDEKDLELNDTTLYAVDGSTLRFYVMTIDGEVPYLVQTVASTNGGLTFDGAKTNVTDLVNAEELTLDLTITEPIMLEVTWEKPLTDFTVTLAVAPGCEEMGTVEGAGTYAAGTKITIKAIAKDSFVFVNWSDGNTDAEREIVVNEDLSLTATFSNTVSGLAEAQANNLAITSEKNGVRVSGLLQGNTVEVFDINGRRVFTTIAETETLFINLQQGMYIIRQGANRGKAIVK